MRKARWTTTAATAVLDLLSPKRDGHPGFALGTKGGTQNEAPFWNLVSNKMLLFSR